MYTKPNNSPFYCRVAGYYKCKFIFQLDISISNMNELDKLLYRLSTNPEVKILFRFLPYEFFRMMPHYKILNYDLYYDAYHLDRSQISSYFTTLIRFVKK